MESGETRAEAHAKAGAALMEADGSEWAAVCFFYAAYHLAVAAISSDPVFNDPARLRRINAELIPDDRHTARHNGRKRGPHGREWGVCELMVVLYDQPVASAYDKLHRASVEVRYETGLRSPLEVVREWVTVVQAAAESGALVCKKP